MKFCHSERHEDSEAATQLIGLLEEGFFASLRMTREISLITLKSVCRN
jgi:hypothetical protein